MGLGFYGGAGPEDLRGILRAIDIDCRHSPSFYYPVYWFLVRLLNVLRYSLLGLSLVTVTRAISTLLVPHWDIFENVIPQFFIGFSLERSKDRERERERERDIYIYIHIHQ